VRRLVAFLELGRPLFLAGGFVLFGLGAAIAAATGHAIDWRRYLLGQAAVTAFQSMTHYANDYFDFDADRANTTATRWSGGSRVLPDGDLPRGVALAAALVLATIGIAVGGVLAVDAGVLAAPTLALVLVLAWSYSAPPMRLCARGLGELDTAVVVTVLVPWLGFYLQAPDLRGGGLLALSIVSPALLQVAMLVAVEFPDAAADAATDKRTLVVRLGPARAANLYATLVALAYAWLPIAWLAGLPAHVVLAAAIPVPIAAWRIAAIADHADRSAHERLTFFAVFLLVTTSAATLAGWLIVTTG